MNQVFMSGHRNRLDIGVGIETGLISVMASNLIFMCGVDIDLVLASGSNLTCFCAGVKIDFGFVCGPKIACF